jgi:hypothetical protein
MMVLNEVVDGKDTVIPKLEGPRFIVGVDAGTLGVGVGVSLNATSMIG